MHPERPINSVLHHVSEKFPLPLKSGPDIFTYCFVWIVLEILTSADIKLQEATVTFVTSVFISCSRVPIWLVIHMEHCLWTMLQVYWGCVQIWEHTGNLPVSTCMQEWCWHCLYQPMLEFFYWPPSPPHMVLVSKAVLQKLPIIGCSSLFFSPLCVCVFVCLPLSSLSLSLCSCIQYTSYTYICCTS